MSTKQSTEARFRMKFRKWLKAERERRKWSQAELAKLLKGKGIDLHPTTIAKIESGDRAVAIHEAAAIADVFQVSLDGLLGRHGLEDEKSHAMTVLADEASQLLPELLTIAERLRDAYGELEQQFGFKRFDQYVAEGKTWSLEGLDIEHQRAMLMWGGRDLAMHALAKLSAGLYEVATVRSMTAQQLTEHLDQITAMLAENAAEWRAAMGKETTGQIAYVGKGNDETQP